MACHPATAHVPRARPRFQQITPFHAQSAAGTRYIVPVTCPARTRENEDAIARVLLPFAPNHKPWSAYNIAINSTHQCKMSRQWCNHMLADFPEDNMLKLQASYKLSPPLFPNVSSTPSRAETVNTNFASDNRNSLKTNSARRRSAPQPRPPSIHATNLLKIKIAMVPPLPQNQKFQKCIPNTRQTECETTRLGRLRKNHAHAM